MNYVKYLLITEAYLQTVNQLPKYLYHATYKPLIKSIIANGLGATTRKNWEASKSNVVYLAKDPFVAESYAEISESVPDEWVDNIVILKIDTSKLDRTQFYMDRNNQDGSTIEYHGIIRKSCFNFFRKGRNQ